jgi:general secretion pathway protein G
MNVRRNIKRGFTLVEILIVVIILGILAAIVIPQFTNASQDARRSSLASTVQTVRSQIELYKLQHGDQLPDLTTADWDDFTTVTVFGGVNMGPYMQAVPKNGFNNSSIVADGNVITAAAATDGFLYDLTGGTGKFWGVEVDTTGAVAALIGDNN